MYILKVDDVKLWEGYIMLVISRTEVKFMSSVSTKIEIQIDEKIDRQWEIEQGYINIATIIDVARGIPKSLSEESEWFH